MTARARVVWSLRSVIAVELAVLAAWVVTR